jgi:hypothetical protein
MRPFQTPRYGEREAEYMAIRVLMTHIGECKETYMRPTGRIVPADLGRNRIAHPGQDNAAQRAGKSHYLIAAHWHYRPDYAPCHETLKRSADNRMGRSGPDRPTFGT